uniref:Ycf1 n=1 Tax=Sesbania tomentosa TaxID=206310 RepID=UPI0026E4860A|nr:Ycf1 [Sesbania tomentosa]WJK72924.1 Ycf1 [Sesbania tomentosa]
MIFQSFILDNLVSLCLKIINSVVVVGLYYGFLTTLSIGPSYLFLLRAQVMEEGTEKKVSATTGFITGQLMMFISIYYAPLHLALGRPHTITVITLPYLLFHFFDNNHKHFLNYGYKNQNSIRNFSIQRIFFKNLLFQLLNPFIFPSSIFIRLVSIYIFRYNNKFLFLTSSFGGWLIGHIFLIKWIGLILVWIEQNNSIKSNGSIRSNKAIMSEFRNSLSQIFLVFLFITCLYYLGKIPPPFFFTKKLSEIQEKNEIDKEKRKIDVERNSEMEGTKQKEKRYIEEDLSVYLFSKKDKNLYKIDEDKTIFGFEKPLVTILFDYNRWNRPLRYIKNDRFENIVRNEISQFYFHICQSDGKERISFTYPPNLSTFLKIMKTKMDLFIREKISYDELDNYWNSTNEEKRKKLSNEFFTRAKILDKEFLPLDILENRIRLCNDDTKTKYLSKKYDPFLNGPFRGQIKKSFLHSIKNETYRKNDIFINKIHGMLLHINRNYAEFDPKINTFDRKSLLTEICFFFKLMSKFSRKSVSSLNFERPYLFAEHEQVKFYSKEKKKFLLDAIKTDLNDKTVVNRNIYIGINEISKKIPRWSYKLIDELEQLEGKKKAENSYIRSRKAKRVVIFTKTSQNDDTYSDTRDTENTEKKKELALIRYSQQPDFRRDIIKGSIRAQRRKTVTWKLLQKSVHSPLFLDKMEKAPLFSFDISESIKMFFMFKNLIRKKTKLKISDYTEERIKESEKKEEHKRKKNEKEEKRRIEIAEAWDSIIFAQVIRGFLLITQSILRKYILLPSLIITKNIVRILLFQFPEWFEDFRDWNKEMYIKCTYNGVQLSETEFPKKWLTDGIQIKILFPFRLKPWHRSKLRSTEKEKDRLKKKKVKKKNFCFLTILGMEVELPFSGYPRNRLSFFDPIFKEFKKKMKKLKNSFLIILKVLNKRRKRFVAISKERAKWIIKSIHKNILFVKEKIKQLPNFLFLFRFKNIYELGDSKKDFRISKNNLMINESPILIESINLTNCSLNEKKIKDLNNKTKTIIKQIEKMTKEKKRGFRTSEINIHSNKTTYDDKRLELQKNILQIFQKRNVRLTRKSYSFFQFFMERVYMDIVLCIISIPRINVQFFFESTKKMINQSIYNKKRNAEGIDKTNESISHLISIRHKSWNSTNMNSQNSYDISSLSQAYVFFKLSKTQIINVYKLKSVFKYPERFFFIKNEKKDYFSGTQRIFDSKLRHKNIPDSVMNQWTSWLKVHYQYDLSESRWSKLVPENWRNRIHEHRVDQKKDLTKCDLYEKTRLILYKKKKQQVELLLKKKKIKKQYGYDLLLYESINYADKKESYIYSYGSLFLANKTKAISYNYNMRKKELFDITDDISLKNYIAEDNIIDVTKNLDRKYFDWIVMNVEVRNDSISNMKFWFFFKFVIFYDAYRSNPWILPIKFLFFHFYVNQNVSKTKNITGKKKRIDILRPLKKKKSLDEFEFETRNSTKAEYASRVDLKSSLSNQERNIEEDYGGLDRKKNGKGKNKKKYKNKIEAELNFLLRKYLGFHLNWKGSLNERLMNNVKVYCLLIRLKNLKEITIASIQRGELSLDIMMIQNQKDFTITELRKNKELIEKGILIIEPVRLSRKNNEQFFMYKITGLSLIHKSKRRINQGNPEKSHLNKNHFDKYIPKTKDQKITENKEKNHYDLLVPENILFARRRRELRILICFNSRNRNSVYRKTILYNENKVNNCCQVLDKNKDLDREKKKLMNLKLFLWPNYRLEDLACINRYWFDTYNGSRFSLIRIHMYPRLKIR